MVIDFDYEGDLTSFTELTIRGCEFISEDEIAAVPQGSERALITIYGVSNGQESALYDVEPDATREEVHYFCNELLAKHRNLLDVKDLCF